MIIVLSDLHLMDGTAGLHYLKADTFKNILRDIADKAREAQAEDVTLLFMGDIYDMIRTTRWFEFPLDERPWGASPSESTALNILDGVIAENKDTFDVLAGSLVDQFGFPVEPKRVYMPGNHDRLCHMYPSLQARVRETLGIDYEGHFSHYYLDAEHGFFGRHGHEWDVFNFESEGPFTSKTDFEIPEEGYLATPIGDVIACEFASRVPLVAVDLLEEHPDRYLVSERLRHLFDVRPVGGMVHWLTYQLSRYDDNVQDAINKAMAQVANEFEAIPFVQQWIESHDKLGEFWDEADRVQALLQTIQSLSRWFAQSDEVFELMSSKEEKEQKEGVLYAWKAAEDFARLDSHPELYGQIQIVCYGHTHTPMQLAVDTMVGEGRPDLERVYINTGTWRPTHLRGIAQKAWVKWNFVTYTIINKPGEIVAEQPAESPAFETWTGTMKELVR